MNGYSHLSRFVSTQMVKYFSKEQILEHLKYCSQLGVNTWQSHIANLELYQMLHDQGVDMHFLALASDKAEDPDMLKQLVSGGAIGVAHHGEVTDVFYKNGELNHVREYCKKVRDTGVMAGVSTHMPDVIKTILDEGWDVDYFMCCVYERHRSREELQQLLGHVPIPIPEVYLESDPPRMFEVMRQTDKPCLAFKILAAGRLCERQETVEQAFRQTFEQIKENDAVIVGMYPEFEDQAALNVQYVKQFG
jgi:hypothetical protein